MFFVVSGFILFYTVNFNKENFYNFVKKRLIRLLPPLIFVLILYYIVSWFTVVKPVHYENIWTLFLLHNIGITLHYSNIGASWFISSMFWTSCLLFYSFKNIKKEYFNIILALAVLFCYSFMAHNKFLLPIKSYYSVINVGMIRAIASMGLGYFIWNLYNDIFIKLRFKKISIISKIIISCAELYLFAFLIQNLIFRTMKYDNLLILILLFSILFILFLINQGFISKLFNNNFSVILGRYVYCILITHEWLRDILRKVVYPAYPQFIENNPVISYGIYLFVTLLLSILIYHLVEKPALKYFKNKFNII